MQIDVTQVPSVLPLRLVAKVLCECTVIMCFLSFLPFPFLSFPFLSSRFTGRKVTADICTDSFYWSSRDGM